MADPLATIDRIMGELAALRAELAEQAADGKNCDEDDFAVHNLLEISTACERFNRPPDSLRWMCRKHGCGKKVGGRWLASGPRLARWLNGGG
jgi:hypothetical protein